MKRLRLKNYDWNDSVAISYVIAIYVAEITDSVKKESKTSVFGSFCMFLPIFEGDFKVN